MAYNRKCFVSQVGKILPDWLIAYTDTIKPVLYQLHCFLVISVLSYLLFEAEDFTGYEDFAVQSLYVFFVHVETQMVKRGRGHAKTQGESGGRAM